ncbi:MAG: 50S ribosomal protein L22 [Clostridia bacterium]|nr:50S ribosomal protein L22 [Clostridia bacterium]
MEASEAKKTRTTSKTTTAKKTTATKTTTAKKTTTKKATEKVEKAATTKAKKAVASEEVKEAKATKAVKATKEVEKAAVLTTNKAKRKAKKAELKEAKRLAPSATLKNARISARKVKIVIDNIRGKNVNEAIAILKFTPKAASPLVEKLLKSAIANAENNSMMDKSKLYVAEVYANQGTTMKRIRAATQGRANRIRKRTSHITIVLKERA